MNFSIIIPTYNNLGYLKVCLESLKKNSEFNHDIIVHINEGSDGTKTYIEQNKINYTFSEINIGLCSAVNIAAKKSKSDFILYSHDDMYFLPGWDAALIQEIKKIPDKKFLLSSMQISHNGPGPKGIEHIEYNVGESLDNFDEQKLLDNYQKFEFPDLQGSHWAPHVIPKTLWNKVGGFSEEFNPGFASDPDLNMKLWNEGVRYFKLLNSSRVYHFGSITTRRKENITRNKGRKTFIKKWKMSPEFFTKHYLKGGKKFDGPLKDQPNKSITYFVELMIEKIKYIFLQI